MDLACELRTRIGAREFSAVRDLILASDLNCAWGGLSIMERLTAFKLLPPESAEPFFMSLSYDQRFELFSGFELEAIAPILEASPEAKSLFRRDPESFREKMAESLREGF